MRMYLDTEFDGFGGDLISMAIVSEDGKEFYEVVKFGLDPWVKANVNTVLGKEPVSELDFHADLEEFFSHYEDVHIVADWPEDFKLLFQWIMTGPGTMMYVPKITAELCRDCSSRKSTIPHNALEDARAIKFSYEEYKEREAMKLLEEENNAE